jgi:hypothetical protein
MICKAVLVTKFVVFLLTIGQLATALIGRASGRAIFRVQRGIFELNGYVPPEADPEFRSMVKKSLRRPIKVPGGSTETATIDVQAALPLPREGDIVLCPGKWKGETVLARVRFLQYIGTSESWVAEVIPLKEGKSVGIYSVDKNAKAYTEKIDQLQPVRSFFVRSENGYKIAFKKNSTEVVKRAPSYRSIPQDYTIPRKVS